MWAIRGMKSPTLSIERVNVQAEIRIRHFLICYVICWILKETDDISRFEYIKKTNKEYGNVLIGIQVSNTSDIFKIDKELDKHNFRYIKINDNDLLYSYLI